MRPIQAKNYSQVSINCLPGKAIEGVEKEKNWALETEEYAIDRSEFDRNALYQPLKYHGMSRKHVRLIPYYAWDNRDYGEMRIWFPVAYTV